MISSRYPMVVLALALALGIFAGSWLQPQTILQGLLLAIIVVMWIAKRVLSVKFILFRDYFLPIAMFAAGVLHGITINTDTLAVLPERKIDAIAIVKDVQKTDKGYKAMLLTEAIQGIKLTSEHLSVMAYMPCRKDRELLPGDIIAIEGTMSALPKPMNPNVFDYGKYLKRKNLQQICYVKLWQPTQEVKSALYIKRWAYSIHMYCSDILDKYLVDKEDAAIAKGLLLGTKSDIPQETLQAFMSSGLMHLLSVSGYHVGLIYLLLRYALAVFYRKKKHTQLSKAIISIIVIWSFALISGMSAAVVRAAMLFTLLQLGKSFAKKTEILNLLAITAVILLFIHPQYLWDIGFQLSYLAMIGLIVIYPKIYALLYFKSKVADTLWQMSAVSIAAMVLTTPLTIYYFGNFPTYFLLTNIYSGIVALAIIVLSILILLFSILHINIGAVWLGNISNLVIKYLFVMPTSWVVHLPAGSINNLYINIVQCIILLMAATIFMYYLYEKKVRWLNTSLIGIVIVILLAYYDTWQSVQNNYLIFYSVKNNIYIGIKKGLLTDIITDDRDNFDKNFSYNIQPSLRATHSSVGKIHYIESKQYNLQYCNEYLKIDNRVQADSINTHILLRMNREVYYIENNEVSNITKNGCKYW